MAKWSQTGRVPRRTARRPAPNKGGKESSCGAPLIRQQAVPVGKKVAQEAQAAAAQPAQRAGAQPHRAYGAAHARHAQEPAAAPIYAHTWREPPQCERTVKLRAAKRGVRLAPGPAVRISSAPRRPAPPAAAVPGAADDDASPALAVPPENAALAAAEAASISGSAPPPRMPSSMRNMDV